MRLVHKRDIELYWETEDNTEIPYFGKFMNQKRFMIILSNFHLSHNNNQTDSLSKIQSMITQTMERFSDVYSPVGSLAFDDATCPWKRGLGFKVYNTNLLNFG